LKTIGFSAFYDCSSLSSVSIPPSVTMIDGSAFSGCISLESVMFSSDSSLNYLGSMAFRDCHSLTSITIPQGVSEIKQRAFSGCTSLKSIDIPANVTEIGWGAFQYCENLTSIVLPTNVPSIGSSTFEGCTNLQSMVYLGYSDPLGKSAFDIFNGCSNLSFVCVPKEYSSSSFCGLNTICKHESCESLFYNHCYEKPKCVNGVISMNKRENASLLEGKSNDCFEFKCLNDSGVMVENKCGRKGQTCEDDKCVEIKPEDERDDIVIEIEVEDMNVTLMDLTDIKRQISDLASIEEEDLKVRVESDDDGRILHIVVIFDGEESAFFVSEVLNEAIKECSSQSSS